MRVNRRAWGVMGKGVLASVAGVLLAGPSLAAVPDWPPATAETRPWTRFWWMGSSVDAAGLRAALEAYHEVGLGGVEITPIYGVRGFEDRFVPYLSPQWMEKLEDRPGRGATAGPRRRHGHGNGLALRGPVGRPRRRLQDHRARELPCERGREPRRARPVIARSRCCGRSAARSASTGSSSPSRRTPTSRRWRSTRCGSPGSCRSTCSWPTPIGRDVLDLTARVGGDGRLDWTAPRRDVDAPRPVPGRSRQARRARGPRRRGQRRRPLRGGGDPELPAPVRRGVRRPVAPRPPRVLQRLLRGRRRGRPVGLDDGALRRVPEAARLRPAARAPGSLRRRRLGEEHAGPRRLPRDALRPAPRPLHDRVAELGRPPRRARAEPGPRLAGQHPGPLRRQRHPRDGGPGPLPDQVGQLRRQRGGEAAGRGRDGHLARRALRLDPRRRARGGRPLLHGRSEPRRLPRDRLLAPGRALARLALLRLGPLPAEQPVVGRLRRAQPLRDARAILPAVRAARQRRAALLPVPRRAFGAGRGAAHALRRRATGPAGHALRRRLRHPRGPGLRVRLPVRPAPPRREREGRRAPDERRRLPGSGASRGALRPARDVRPRLGPRAGRRHGDRLPRAPRRTCPDCTTSSRGARASASSRSSWCSAPRTAAA